MSNFPESSPDFANSEFGGNYGARSGEQSAIGHLGSSTLSQTVELTVPFDLSNPEFLDCKTVFVGTKDGVDIVPEHLLGLFQDGLSTVAIRTISDLFDDPSEYFAAMESGIGLNAVGDPRWAEVNQRLYQSDGQGDQVRLRFRHQ